jgi:hypothetical protein
VSRRLRVGDRLPNRPGMQDRPWNSERSERGGHRDHPQVFLLTVTVGNLALKSRALPAIDTAMRRATAL